MYNIHQDANQIPLELETENYEYNGESIPALTASASEKDRVTSITITNANPNKTVPLTLNLTKNFNLVIGKIVTGNEITDYNDFGKNEKVFIADFNVGEIINQKLNF